MEDRDLKTAKALGLTLPQSLLLGEATRSPRAKEVAWNVSTISSWSEQVSLRGLLRGAVRQAGRSPWWIRAPSGARARSAAACRRRFWSAWQRPSTPHATWPAKG